MQLTQRFPAFHREYWRVVWVLTVKDIVEAIKNKTTLTIILGLALTMLTVQALPLLLKLDSRPRLAIYDAARTSLADTLRQEQVVQVLEMRTEVAAIAAARETSSDLLSVILPSDWENGSGTLTLDGYLVHWIAAGAADLIAQSEQALTDITGRQVTILPHIVYPTRESGGHSLMVAFGLPLIIILISAILVPYLFIDEKKAHTLEVLQVSPAAPAQVVLGKGLAGLVYGVLAAAILLAFNFNLVVFWGLMAVAVLAGALLGVAVGLLIGLVVENEGSVQLWVGVLTVLFMFPLVLALADGGGLPAWTQAVLSWLPSTAMFDLFRLSFGNVWQPAVIARNLAIILGSAVLIYAWVVQRLRRWEA